MKNKKLIVVLALALVAMLAVGITVAWFTDTETKTNVATMGDVDVSLDENVDDPSAVEGATENPEGTVDDPSNPQYTVEDPENPGFDIPLLPGEETDEGAEYPASQPGTSYVKAPSVNNEREDVFLRLVVTRSWSRLVATRSWSNDEGDIEKIILHLINEDEWTHVHEGGVDYFYYNSILKTDETTPAPFDYFTISSSVGNEYVGAVAQVVVKAEAVQAAGLSANYNAAINLPAEIWAGVNAE